MSSRFKKTTLFAKAAYQLAVARLQISLFSAKTFRNLALNHKSQGEPEALDPRQEKFLKSLRWSIQSAAKRVPFDTSCLVQALAAARILEAHNTNFSVHYSVHERTSDRITGHIWITVGDLEITPSHEMNGFVEFTPIADI